MFNVIMNIAFARLIRPFAFGFEGGLKASALKPALATGLLIYLF
jgi:hypothetical protein